MCSAMRTYRTHPKPHGVYATRDLLDLEQGEL